MGTCLSKNNTCSSPPHVEISDKKQDTKPDNLVTNKKVEGKIVRKEIFVIKHRVSHERPKDEKGVIQKANESAKNPNFEGESSKKVAISSSSCIKEEVDAFVMQCGRFSRSSSTSKGFSFSGSGESSDNTNNNPNRKTRKYSSSMKSFDFDTETGNRKCYSSKKSFDFDNENEDKKGPSSKKSFDFENENGKCSSSKKSFDSDNENGDRKCSSSMKSFDFENENGDRKCFSSKRSFDFDNENRRDRSRGGSRRASRSPGKRSESPISASNCANLGSKPGKMVSVPAKVSSFMIDKSNDVESVELISAAAIQRIQVRRNVGAADATVGSRTAASPRARSRSRSPARLKAKVSNENKNCQQQPLSLSRNNSRRREDFALRRNPLFEVDTPGITEPMQFYPQVQMKKLNAESISETEDKLGIISKSTIDCSLTDSNDKVMKQQLRLAEEAKSVQTVAGNASGLESLMQQGIRRNGSSRLSGDLDMNLGVGSNPTPSYTELLLEDIESFHKKSSNNTGFSLPPSVTKACSILEAVADLNSGTSSYLSSAFVEDRTRNPTIQQLNKMTNTSLEIKPLGKKKTVMKEPLMEFAVSMRDDFKEPSIQKFVSFTSSRTTCNQEVSIVEKVYCLDRREIDGGDDIEEPESSGSNIVGGNGYHVSLSLREPNSIDSTNSCAPSKTFNKRESFNPLGFRKLMASEFGPDMDEGRRKVTANTTPRIPGTFL